jgi:pyridoxal/pyridoxine/pyridoxamine kinase
MSRSTQAAVREAEALLREGHASGCVKRSTGVSCVTSWRITQRRDLPRRYRCDPVLGHDGRLRTQEAPALALFRERLRGRF